MIFLINIFIHLNYLLNIILAYLILLYPLFILILLFRDYFFYRLSCFKSSLNGVKLQEKIIKIK